MSEEELTPEETQAMGEMQADAPVDVKEPEVTPEKEAEQEEPKQEAAAAEEKAEEKGEFKSTRGDEKPPEGFVPHQAMHAERENRKRVESELAELKAWKDAQEAKSAEQPPQWVDPLEDPEGHRRFSEYQAKALTDRLDAQEAQTRQTNNQAARASQANQFEQEFAAKTSDYQDAAQFMHNHRISELRAQGYGDAEIGQQISADANAIFDAAQSIGMNPAQMLYFRAQSAGYTKADKPAGDDAGAKIAKLSESQSQTQGMASAGGAEQSGKITAAQLAEMSEAELAKVSNEDIAAAMGG